MRKLALASTMTLFGLLLLVILLSSAGCSRIIYGNCTPSSCIGGCCDDCPPGARGVIVRIFGRCLPRTPMLPPCKDKLNPCPPAAGR